MKTSSKKLELEKKVMELIIKLQYGNVKDKVLLDEDII
jgi:hypothetical protein